MTLAAISLTGFITSVAAMWGGIAVLLWSWTTKRRATDRLEGYAFACVLVGFILLPVSVAAMAVTLASMGS